MKIKNRSTIILMLTLLLLGCSSKDIHYYSADESALHTRGGVLGDNGIYHDVLYNPESVALNFDGFIVGLDKSPRTLIGAGDDNYRAQPQEGMSRVIRRLDKDYKTHYISHIIHDRGLPYGRENCAVYSVYNPSPLFPHDVAAAERAASPLFSFCPPAQSSNASPISHTVPPRQAFEGSREGLQALKTALLASIDEHNRSGHPYTHAIVVVMGWNTPQIEAIRNFNSIMSHLDAVARQQNQPFNPLFVGVTWSSYWDENWFDVAVRLASYPNKADDADEIGASWLGSIVDTVHSTINQRGKNRPEAIPLIAIGHSFGARAVSMAVCQGPQFRVPASPVRTQGSPVVDLFIGLEPAVSLRRFLTGSVEKIQYNDCAAAKHIVMTASRYDSAVSSSLWVDMVGNAFVYQRTCEDNKSDRVSCKTACANGDIVDGAGQCGTAKPVTALNSPITYIDASRLIRFNQPNTGGNAHSDIYRPDTGKFIWNAISAASHSGAK
ncbi:hypothetical protein [Musicola keenii]|uniref:hypothetical protein n=1 Tax=Musicola keenii TaxID=2884250 RepID=UPI0017873053|nr:hypothetical protein [Musicola keenii]